jgi:hypothetical protein
MGGYDKKFRNQPIFLEILPKWFVNVFSMVLISWCSKVDSKIPKSKGIPKH